MTKLDTAWIHRYGGSLLLAIVMLAFAMTHVQAAPSPELQEADSDPSDEDDADRETTECIEKVYPEKIQAFNVVLTDVEFAQQFTISSLSGTNLYVKDATCRVTGLAGAAAVVVARVRIFDTGRSASIPAGQPAGRYSVGTIQPKKDYLIEVDANLQKEGVTITVSGELWADRVKCIRP